MNNIIQYIDSLIRQEAKMTSDGYRLDFEDIDEIDHEAIAAMLIARDDLNLDCLVNDEVAKTLIKHLTNAHCDNYDLSAVIRKSTVNYYEDAIRSLITQRLEQYEDGKEFESNLQKISNRQTVGIHWGAL